MGAFTSQGAGVTKATAKAQASGLLQTVMRVVSFRRRNLPFSSICVTQNGQAPPHRDRNNDGVSSIITCGQFRGGELLAEKVQGKKHIPIGNDSRVQAEAVQCRGCWNYFSAQQWHMVLPFRGERVSIALYCCRHLHRLTLSCLQELVRLGFQLPSDPLSIHSLAIDPQSEQDPGEPTSGVAYVIAADWRPSAEDCSDEEDGPNVLDQLVADDVEQLDSQVSHRDMRCLGHLGAVMAASTPPGAGASPAPHARSRDNSLRERASPASKGMQTLAQQLVSACVESKSSFGRFYRAGVRSVQSSRLASVHPPGAADMGAATFPMGLPYPCALLAASPPLSSRRRQRYWAARKVQHLTNLMVAQWTWLSMGSPRRGMGAAVLSQPLNPLQSQCVAAHASHWRAFCRADSLGSAGGDKLQHLLSQLSAGKDATPYGVRHGQTITQPPQTPVTVTLTPENLALPATAAKIPLDSPVVPKLFGCILREEGIFDLEPEARPKPPRAFWQVAKWHDVASRLCEVGMIQLCEHVPGRLRTGLFGVPKKGSELVRIIVDRRPQNSQQRRLIDVALQRGLECGLDPSELLHHQRLCCLPHPSQFVDMCMPWNAWLRTSAEDCSDYYYMLRHPWARVHETVVGHPVWSWQLSALALERGAAPLGHPQGQRLDLCLCAPAMGDSRSPDVAQAAHQHILLESEHKELASTQAESVGLHPSRWLTYGWPVPRGAHWQGAYVDDLLLVSIVSEGFDNWMGTQTASEHDGIMSRVQQRYEEVKLIRKESKARHAEKEAEAWGCTLSSKDRTVGASIERRVQVMRALALAIRMRAISPSLMEVLVGHVTYCLLFRRAILCSLSHVYSWLQAHKGSRLAVLIPPHVRDELATAMLLLPCATSQLTAVLSQTVLSTDATTRWGGVCSATLKSPEEAVFLWGKRRPRHCRMVLAHGDPQRLLTGPEESLPRDCHLHQLVASTQFVERVRYKFRGDSHINILEGHAWLTGLRWFCRQVKPSRMGTRLICVGDSQVWTHVLQRGRSSSQRLNRVATQALPWLLAHGIQVVPLWVESECNPSDDPTRGAKVRAAKTRPPEIDEELRAVAQTYPMMWYCTDIAWKETMMEYDCTKGYHGEGPIKRSSPAGLDLTLSVQPATRARYECRITHFLDWLAAYHVETWGQSAESLAQAPETLSALLCEYLQHLANADHPRTWGTEILAAWQHFFPTLQNRLSTPWLRQRVWIRSQPMAMRIPLPLEVVLAISVTARCQHRPRLAAALLLMYHCMLRPGEVANMRRQDVILPQDVHGDAWTGVVCIQQSKTSTRFARLQSVIIEDHALLQLAMETFGDDPPTRYLVHGGVRELVKAFISIKALLGLAETPYVLAGYRGGGACEYLRRTANLSYLQFRGRWANVKSMWHYLQLGLAASTFRAIPAATQTLVLELAACASDVFSTSIRSFQCARPHTERGVCQLSYVSLFEQRMRGLEN
eukprot:6492534-Amphidinium_carterae.3